MNKEPITGIEILEILKANNIDKQELYNICEHNIKNNIFFICKNNARQIEIMNILEDNNCVRKISREIEGYDDNTYLYEKKDELFMFLVAQ